MVFVNKRMSFSVFSHAVCAIFSHNKNATTFSEKVHTIQFCIFFLYPILCSLKTSFFSLFPDGRLLWDFLQQLLNDPSQRYTSYIAWKNRDSGVFKIVDPAGLAKLWGIQKNHLSMNYDKMSRALRYYYRVNILRKVQGERHCYQFLRNPTELKNIKNISLLRQQMSPTRTAPPQMMNPMAVKPEPMDEQKAPTVKSEEFEEGPTDLSMNGRHVDIICSPDTQSLREPPPHYYNSTSEEK